MIVIYLPVEQEEPKVAWDYTKTENKPFHELMPKVKLYDNDQNTPILN